MTVNDIISKINSLNKAIEHLEKLRRESLYQMPSMLLMNT